MEPWGYYDNLNFFTEVAKRVNRMSDVYMHRELLGYSKEKRFIELITLTSLDNDLSYEGDLEREQTIHGPGLFPKFSSDSEEARLFS